MRSIFILLLSAIMASLLQVPAAYCAEQDAEKEMLPALTLPIPDNDSVRLYLGLDATVGESFDLREIDTDVLVIELFSMYCPFCQDEAGNVNTLFEMMTDFSTPEYSVKMIGLGANNSAFEVEHFRTTYGVRFPLFPDQDMSMYNALGGKGTPGFIACKMEEDGGCTIIHRQSGGFYHVEDFFKELLNKSGYNQ